MNFAWILQTFMNPPGYVWSLKRGSLRRAQRAKMCVAVNFCGSRVASCRVSIHISLPRQSILYSGMDWHQNFNIYTHIHIHLYIYVLYIYISIILYLYTYIHTYIYTCNIYIYTHTWFSRDQSRSWLLSRSFFFLRTRGDDDFVMCTSAPESTRSGCKIRMFHHGRSWRD